MANDDLLAIEQRAKERALQEAEQQARDLAQQGQEARRGTLGVVDQYLDPLRQATGPFGLGQGVFSATSSARSGIEEFQRVLGLAQGGDTEALSQLVGVGSSTLGSARQAYASGPEFGRIFNEINKGLLDAQQSLEEQRTMLVREGIDVQRQTVSELVRLRVELIERIDRQTAELARDRALAQQRLAA